MTDSDSVARNSAWMALGTIVSRITGFARLYLLAFTIVGIVTGAVSACRVICGQAVASMNGATSRWHSGLIRIASDSASACSRVARSSAGRRHPNS